MEQVARFTSLDEYLAIETVSNIKHEYDSGAIFAKAGGSKIHNDLTLNVYAALRPGLSTRRCSANVADLRLRTPSGLYAYPDVIVICGSPLVTGENPETVTNAVVLVEVPYVSTREYDRTRKFEHYQSIPTLRDYLLIEQESVDVEHRKLERNVWRSERLTMLDDAVRLAGVDVTLRLSDIYGGVDM